MIQHHTQVFKALSDATRLRIVLLLLKHGELCVCDIMTSLVIPQSTVSRHLSILRNAGFVEGERRGAWMYYQVITEDTIQTRLLHTVREYGSSWPEVRTDSRRLGEYLKTKETSSCEQPWQS
jgi:ArsR family transcriptional regulator